MVQKKRICIIGAGISGLATCKHLVEKGFRPVVFEADQTIGGVWKSTLASTRLQTPKWDYQFSDFPWPEKVVEVCPSFEVWGFPLKYLFFNRFAELLFHKPGGGLILSLLAFLLSPLVWIFSKIAEIYFLKIIPMKKHGMVPEHSFFQAISSCLLCILPDNFYNKVEEGSIVLKPSKAFSFCKNGVEVEVEGERQSIDSDLVIFATGFKGDQKLRNIFVSSKFQEIVAGIKENVVPLYRECIHPQIPQMAIIGFAESISNLYTTEIRARWLSHFLHGKFKLPSKISMEKNVMEWEKHVKKYSGSRYRGSCISTLHIWNNDQLCKDMGCNPRRKKGFLKDWFLPYSPADYAELD